jgi:hypothetical protein
VSAERGSTLYTGVFGVISAVVLMIGGAAIWINNEQANTRADVVALGSKMDSQNGLMSQRIENQGSMLTKKIDARGAQLTQIQLSLAALTASKKR